MSGSQTSADIRDSRTMQMRVQSVMQTEAAANTNRDIPYNWAFLTRETLRHVESGMTRMLPFVAATPEVIAEWESGVASEMENPADNVTDATLTGSVQANWVAASEGL